VHKLALEQSVVKALYGYTKWAKGRHAVMECAKAPVTNTMHEKNDKLLMCDTRIIKIKMSKLFALYKNTVKSI
jgi:hypothetical protein